MAAGNQTYNQLKQAVAHPSTKLLAGSQAGKVEPPAKVLCL